MLFDLTLFFKLIVSILIIICLFFLLRQICKRRLSNIIISVILLIILIILLYIPNYMKKLPIQAKEVVTISNSGLINSKKLIIGIEGNHYPWNYVTNNGSPQGFDIDIVREIAKRMHLKPDFVIEPTQSLVSNLQSKQYDLIISFMLTIMSDMKDKIDFSIPYAQIKTTFFSKNSKYSKYIDADLLTLKKVLKDQIVGAQIGTNGAIYLSKEFKNIVKIKYYNTQSQLMTDVALGRVDLGFSSVPSIGKFIESNKNIIMFGPKLGIQDSSLLHEGISLAVAKDNKVLLQKINEALKSMQEDYTIRNLSIKYFNDDISYY